MKTVVNLTFATMTFLALNGPATAERPHTLDDIRAAEAAARQAAFIQRRLAMNDPKLLQKMQKELQNKENSDPGNAERFPGEGHKVGGDKYVNRLLGIDHKEGKRLAKLAKKKAKAAKKARRALMESNRGNKSIAEGLVQHALKFATASLIAPAA